MGTFVTRFANSSRGSSPNLTAATKYGAVKCIVLALTSLSSGKKEGVFVTADERGGSLAVTNGMSSAAAIKDMTKIYSNSEKPRSEGSWVRGQENSAEGNRLYGAIYKELGVPLWSLLAFGHVDGVIDDTFGVFGARPSDGDFGLDSARSQQAIKDGAGC